jgi:hypothetical protein
MENARGVTLSSSEKRRQLFFTTSDETLSVIAMRASNPDRAPARIHG